MPEVYAPEAEVDSSLRRKPAAYLQLSVGEKALVATSLKSSSSPILTFFMMWNLWKAIKMISPHTISALILTVHGSYALGVELGYVAPPATQSIV